MFGYLDSGAKTTGPIVKKFCFLNLIFMSVRILGFNAIHSVIKKMFHKGPTFILKRGFDFELY
jgi:hypothetical protein